MKVGVNLITYGPGATPDSLARWAGLAEALGYHFVMVSDHVATTPDVQAEYPTPFFHEASSNGDTDSLISLLSEEVVHYSNGGKTRAALKPIRGADKVARLFSGLLQKAPPRSTDGRLGTSTQPPYQTSESGDPHATERRGILLVPDFSRNSASRWSCLTRSRESSSSEASSACVGGGGPARQ